MSVAFKDKVSKQIKINHAILITGFQRSKKFNLRPAMHAVIKLLDIQNLRLFNV